MAKWVPFPKTWQYVSFPLFSHSREPPHLFTPLLGILERYVTHCHAVYRVAAYFVRGGPYGIIAPYAPTRKAYR